MSWQEETELMQEIYEYLQDHSLNANLAGARGVVDGDLMAYLNDEAGIYFVNRTLAEELRRFYMTRCLDLGVKLFVKGYCLFENRFVIPILDVNGDIIAFSCWGFGQEAAKKYLTVVGSRFGKSKDFYNIENAILLGGGRYVVVVEGMFDAVALNACNIPSVATMGSDVSVVKKTMLSLFQNIIVFADNDKVGREVSRKWCDGLAATLLRFEGELKLSNGLSKDVKDAFDLVNYLGVERTKELFREVFKSKTKEFVYNLEDLSRKI